MSVVPSQLVWSENICWSTTSQLITTGWVNTRDGYVRQKILAEKRNFVTKPGNVQMEVKQLQMQQLTIKSL